MKLTRLSIHLWSLMRSFITRHSTTPTSCPISTLGNIHKTRQISEQLLSHIQTKRSNNNIPDYRRFSFCHYPFVLSMTAKTMMLKLDSERQMLITAKVDMLVLPLKYWLYYEYNCWLTVVRDLCKKRCYKTKLRRQEISSSISPSEEHTSLKTLSKRLVAMLTNRYNWGCS